MDYSAVVFRVYSHDKAWLGARSLLAVLRAPTASSASSTTNPVTSTDKDPESSARVISYRPLDLRRFITAPDNTDNGTTTTIPPATNSNNNARTASQSPPPAFDLMLVEPERKLHELGDFLIRSTKLAPRYDPAVHHKQLFDQQQAAATTSTTTGPSKCAVEVFVHSARRCIMQETRLRADQAASGGQKECVHQQAKW